MGGFGPWSENCSGTSTEDRQAETDESRKSPVTASRRHTMGTCQ